ncbi:hypothetical protein H7X46_17990 [Pseudonocardia sp. C8]|uniref:hypothetical protein n=1 Tax=Pseudonocardia sp. C8 TaxID=2762759 RepID=UPI001642A7A7|nr:hypothetical protein [Pseudonocardia sp. C8]MBC3192953.1 hypothetical protein [Pseudonocardia sp. C8]
MTIKLFPGQPPITGDAPGLAFHEKASYRAAAGHARRALPGPVGELVHRELTAYAEFGHRFGDGLIPRLMAAVLAMPSDGRPDATRGLSRRDADAG